MEKMTKKEVYASFGIEYDTKAQKIFAPEFGWIKPLLKDGNSKVGKSVKTFSTLATNQTFTIGINGKLYTVKGTCPCNCKGCYATKGFYCMPSTKRTYGIITYLCRNNLDFVKNALVAQIIANNIKTIRIHCSGDFYSDDYIAMWKDIAKAFPNVIMWTYTKNKNAECAFDNIPNANIVKSIIPGIGFNFGHCDFIMSAYETIKARGESVFICKCGVDKNQHCENCKGCINNKYVLFLEHSTNYNAEKDAKFPAFTELVNSQGDF